MKLPYSKTLSLALLTVLLASCSSSGVKQTPTQQRVDTRQEEAQQQTPESLLSEGKDMDAAMLYLKNANRAEPSMRATYQLKAAQILLDNQMPDIASNIVEAIDLDVLSQPQMDHLTYIRIQLALIDRQPQKSLALLKNFESQQYQALTTEKNLLQLYIKTYELLNDYLAATQYRMRLEPLLLEDGEVVANQIAIIRVLLSLSIEELNHEFEASNDKNVQDWLDLSLLIKKSKNPFRLSDMLVSWKSLHQEHRLRDEIIAMLAPKAEDQNVKLDNIALMLPLSGPYQNAGKAVRDGFLTSYYTQDVSDIRPNIKIYDSASAENIIEIYQNATNDGADIIVGPLTKENVTTLAKHGQHLIPMLALNNLEEENFYHNNFYQFSLSPEEEAKQVAQRAWLDGHNRAAVITPDNKWGKRLAKAFKEEWEKQGGEIATESEYDSRKNDFSKPIKSLLAIDESEQRKRNVMRLLQTKVRFEPRRRQDIDIIFMAALPRQARLIPPQLEFYHAEFLPIYTTSHSFGGRTNNKNDRDLNGVLIADMPWTLSDKHMESIKKQIYQSWPNKTKQFNRLYALGVDSYNLLYYLKWLRGNSEAQIHGATGTLQMNEQNQVMRQLSWARFSSGLPRIIASSSSAPVIKSQ